MCKFPSKDDLKIYFFLIFLLIIMTGTYYIWKNYASNYQNMLFALCIVLAPALITWIYRVICDYGNSNENSNNIKAAEVTALIILLMISLMTLFYVNKEQKLSRDFKKLDNFMSYNQLYSDWYLKVTEEENSQVGPSKKTDKLNSKQISLARRYFNLYSQEYYMYQEKMIPEKMWTEVIHGKAGNCHSGAILTLKQFPMLIKGYDYWKKKGAFAFPIDFRRTLDQKLLECGLYDNMYKSHSQDDNPK